MPVLSAATRSGGMAAAFLDVRPCVYAWAMTNHRHFEPLTAGVFNGFGATVRTTVAQAHIQWETNGVWS